MLQALTRARSVLEQTARDFDAPGLSGREALRAVDELGTLRRLVDGMLAKASHRVAQTGAHVLRGERDAASCVARAVGVKPRDVRDAIATATGLGELPATDAAVRSGLLSHEQASLIVQAASMNPCAERELLDAAEHGFVPLRDACIAARARVETPEARAARQHAQRSLRTWTDVDGMLAGHFRLTPEVGAQVKAVLDARVQRAYRARRSGARHEPQEALAADALCVLVLGDEPRAGASATVHVVVDHGALMRGGAIEGETCEVPGVGPVDVAWARELLGSAFLTAVVKRGRDILTVAHIGRHVPAEVRTALVVSGRECDVEGCHQRGYLERDHTHAYAHGGSTSFENLGWLCYAHHRLKSSGWLLGPRLPLTRKRTLRPPPSRAA